MDKYIIDTEKLKQIAPNEDCPNWKMFLKTKRMLENIREMLEEVEREMYEIVNHNIDI